MDWSLTLMIDEIELEVLLEAGSDGGDFKGYYCRGHVDPHHFAAACNHETGAKDSFDRRFTTAKHVRHEYWRTVPIADDPGQQQFVKSEKGRGAWAVTVADPVIQAENRQYKQEREQRALGEASGQRTASWEAVSFIYKKLGYEAALEFAQEWNASSKRVQHGDLSLSNLQFFHKQKLFT